MEKISTEDIANLNTVWELPKNKKPIVIIGAGGIVSDAHLPAYKKANFPVRGIYDPDVEKAKQCAENYSIEKIYSSEEEALADKDVVFDIAVPPQVLLGIVQKIPNNSICQLQKPMGNSMTQAKRIKEIINEKNIQKSLLGKLIDNINFNWSFHVVATICNVDVYIFFYCNFSRNYRFHNHKPLSGLICLKLK